MIKFWFTMDWVDNNERPRLFLRVPGPLYLLLLMTLVPVSEQGNHEDRLIRNIFKGYNPYSRPVEDESASVQVRFKIDLQQVIDVDEKNERLISNIWLNYDWHDPKLTWDPAAYGGIESIRIPNKYIWTPDILLYNSVDEEIDSKFPTNIVIYSSGDLSWIPPGIYQTSCSIDIKWFPFDQQECPMKFGSWTYDSSKINLTLNEPHVVTDSYQPSGEWDLVDATAKRNEIKYDCCPAPYLDLTFMLVLRRRTLYYGFNLIIPCALISSLTLLTFCLPPDAGEKISLGITILLSLSVFQMIVADMVPSTSLAVPLIGVYFSCIMVVCTVSVIMTVLVLNFHHRNPDMYEMPEWVRKVICEWLAWILRVQRPGKEISRDYLMRKKKMRGLATKQPQSRSLISNVRDVDTCFPLKNDNFNQLKSVRIDDLNCKSELYAILNEIRFITQKMKDDSINAEEVNDWKFAALVVDRLCLIVFLLYTAAVSLGIFCSLPKYN